MEAQAVVDDLIPTGGKSVARVVDVRRAVALVHEAEMNQGVLERLKLQRNFRLTRAGRHGCAKRIEETFRSAGVASVNYCVVKLERLLKLDVISLAIVIVRTRQEGVAG